MQKLVEVDKVKFANLTKEAIHSDLVHAIETNIVQVVEGFIFWWIPDLIVAITELVGTPLRLGLFEVALVWQFRHIEPDLRSVDSVHDYIPDNCVHFFIKHLMDLVTLHA